MRRPAAASRQKPVLLRDTTYSISAFGQDQAGELYLVSFGGSVFKIVPAP